MIFSSKECYCCLNGVHDYQTPITFGKTNSGFYTNPLREIYDGVYMRIGKKVYAFFKMVDYKDKLFDSSGDAYFLYKWTFVKTTVEPVR